MAIPVKSSRSAILLLTLSLVFLSTSLLSARTQSGQQASELQEATGWKTFHDPRVPFEFSYPGDFFLKATVNPQLGFVFALLKKLDAPKNDWLVDIDFEDRAEYSEASYVEMSFEQFAIDRAKIQCMSDGPDGSRTCTDVLRKTRFQNRHGIKGIELYLRLVDERIDPPKTTRSTFGPLYVVLLPGGRSGQLLLIKGVEKERGASVTREVLKQIAQSVKLAP